MEQGGNEHAERVEDAWHGGPDLQKARRAANTALDALGRGWEGRELSGLEGDGGIEGLFGDEEKWREQRGEENGEDGVRGFEEQDVQNVDANGDQVRIGVLGLEKRGELGPQRFHVVVEGDLLGAGGDASRDATDRLHRTMPTHHYVQIALVCVREVRGGNPPQSSVLHDELRHESGDGWRQPRLVREGLWRKKRRWGIRIVGGIECT